MGKCIVQINSSTVGSTGRIMFMIAEKARKCGYTVYTASAVHGNEEEIKSKQHIYIGNKIDKKIHLILAKNTGYNGCFSRSATWLFLKKLDKIKPDLLHFHNLHNGYINLPMLFHYVEKNKIPVVWTLHDCWSFTGHCPYYDFVDCNKWKTGCFECVQLEKYPYSKVDRSKEMYNLKKEWFTHKKITLVTPSMWLRQQVKESFLKDYPVKVINNGIDLSIFKHLSSDFRKKYKAEGKTIVLGVANPWAPRKGLDIFARLAEELDNSFQIIVVGVSKEQIEMLPKNIISISKTNNQREMAELYSVADVFVNPTREENFPTTNIEALACGTGVITYRTGGSPEMLTADCGIVVDKDNYQALKHAVLDIKVKPFIREKCRNQAEKYSNESKYQEYITLFDDILEGE